MGTEQKLFPAVFPCKKAGNNLSAQFYASENIRPFDPRHNPDHGREKPLFTPLVLWYNSRKAAIILVFMAGRCAGFACSRPNGQLYHSAAASWYNSCIGLFLPREGNGGTMTAVPVYGISGGIFTGTVPGTGKQSIQYHYSKPARGLKAG